MPGQSRRGRRGLVILPRFAAAVAELADALDSGSSGSNIPWRFDSSQPHERPAGPERGLLSARTSPRERPWHGELR